MHTLHSAKLIFEKQRDHKLTTFQIGFLSYYILMGPGLILLAISYLIFSGSFVTLFWLLGVIHCGLCYWFFKDIYNDKICARMMLDALQDGGKQLVWVYAQNIVTLQNALQEIDIHFHFLNKKHGTIGSQNQDLLQLIDVFSDTFPDISIGYSEELAKQFKMDPAQLKRIPNRNGAILTTTVDNSASNCW